MVLARRALCALFVAALACSVLAGMQCLDNSGQPVDWWLMMKLPLNVGPVSGYSYLYWDAKDASSAKSGDFHYHDQAVGYTVMQLGLYGASVSRLKEDYAWVLWNDESYGNWQDKEPVEHWNDTHGIDYGHTKGVLAVQLSAQTGFYLQHSAPAFPYNHTASPNYWHFPWSQSVFAQHFLCISIGSAQVELVAQVARYYYAYVYESQVPRAATTKYPQLTALAAMHYVNGSGSASVKTLGGVTFTQVGKSGSLDADLYEDLVAPQLRSGVHVQSWCCGSGGDCCQPAYCKSAPIVNASGPQKSHGETHYAYDSLDVLGVNWGNDLHYLLSGNHAKWVVAEDASTQGTCFGDINRMISQRARGGGALCVAHPQLYAIMSAAVVKVDPCA